jgi:hypothetical protein
MRVDIQKPVSLPRALIDRNLGLSSGAFQVVKSKETFPPATCPRQPPLLSTHHYSCRSPPLILVPLTLFASLAEGPKNPPSLFDCVSRVERGREGVDSSTGLDKPIIKQWTSAATVRPISGLIDNRHLALQTYLGDLEYSVTCSQALIKALPKACQSDGRTQMPGITSQLL